LARAALSAAGYNVRINISSLENKKIGKPLLSELHVLETFALELEAEIPHAMHDRCGISLE
jgi:formiminotetrahydrofolate cyclodeaminase